MERLLHYVWKHRLYPLAPLETTDGRSVEVIDPGLHNRSDAGPDFFNAKVRIGGTLWVGNVELHDRSSDWHRHGHGTDGRYDNVVLHVVGLADAEVQNSRGEYLPQMVLPVPEAVSQGYEQLLAADRYPPCYRVVPQLPRLVTHAWLAALATERLEEKTAAIAARAERMDGSWEAAYFVTLARNFGFGINGDAFEQWAASLPLSAVAKHRDDLFQVETLFMGVAGLLDPEVISPRHRAAALADDYFQRQREEWRYLSHKFSLSPIDHRLWRFLRLRPQNFPQIRLSQLARLYHEGRSGLSALLEAATLDDLRLLLSTHATAYWQTHHAYGCESRAAEKRLSRESLDVLIVNTAIPVLFAVGRHRQKDELCDRAFDLLEQLAPERNHIVDLWQECGLEAHSSADSQALIQLRRRYCDRKDCLRCRIGHEYLKTSL